MTTLSKVLEDLDFQLKKDLEFLKREENLKSHRAYLELSKDKMPKEVREDYEGLTSAEHTELLKTINFVVPEVRSVLKIKDWNWFDLGDLGSIWDMMPLKKLVETNAAENMPYPNTAITGEATRSDGSKSHITWFCTRIKVREAEASPLLDGLFVSIALRTHRDVEAEYCSDVIHTLLAIRICLVKTDTVWKYQVMDKNGDFTPTGLDRTLYSTGPLLLMKILKCTNVTTQTEVFPPKVNKKRQASGKILGFDKHILRIKPSNSTHAGESLGGTHNSPRLHFRRGHIRHWKDGLIWVRECMVGNRVKGIVEKDYQVEVS